MIWFWSRGEEKEQPSPLELHDQNWIRVAFVSIVLSLDAFVSHDPAPHFWKRSCDNHAKRRRCCREDLYPLLLFVAEFLVFLVMVSDREGVQCAEKMRICRGSRCWSQPQLHAPRNCYESTDFSSFQQQLSRHIKSSPYFFLADTAN